MGDRNVDHEGLFWKGNIEVRSEPLSAVDAGLDVNHSANLAKSLASALTTKSWRAVIEVRFWSGQE